MEILNSLYDFFPTAVNTGSCLVLVSEDWKVEMWEHRKRPLDSPENEKVFIRVKFFKKTLNGQWIQDQYVDFDFKSVNVLADQIERYIQFSIGKKYRENP